MEVKDSNWNLLVAGDSVVIIKDLPVKWGKPIKRWTKVKNIRIYSEEEVEGESRWCTNGPQDNVCEERIKLS